jgi:hypothetical protein
MWKKIQPSGYGTGFATEDYCSSSFRPPIVGSIKTLTAYLLQSAWKAPQVHQNPNLFTSITLEGTARSSAL